MSPDVAQGQRGRCRVAVMNTYQTHAHAFEHGCGRETMMFWVLDASGEWFPKGMIRSVIWDLVRCGVFQTATRTKGNYWVFSAKPVWRIQEMGLR